MVITTFLQSSLVMWSEQVKGPNSGCRLMTQMFVAWSPSTGIDRHLELLVIGLMSTQTFLVVISIRFWQMTLL